MDTRPGDHQLDEHQLVRQVRDHLSDSSPRAFGRVSHRSGLSARDLQSGQDVAQIRSDISLAAVYIKRPPIAMASPTRMGNRDATYGVSMDHAQG